MKVELIVLINKLDNYFSFLANLQYILYENSENN